MVHYKKAPNGFIKFLSIDNRVFSRAGITATALSKQIVGKISTSLPSYSGPEDVPLLPKDAATSLKYLDPFLSPGSAMGTFVSSRLGTARSCRWHGAVRAPAAPTHPRSWLSDEAISDGLPQTTARSWGPHPLELRRAPQSQDFGKHRHCSVPEAASPTRLSAHEIFEHFTLCSLLS